MSSSIAIVAALDAELSVIASKVQVDERIFVRPAVLTRGRFQQQPIVIVRSGIGREAMRHALDYAIAAFAPAQVMHLGFCGAAAPGLVQGDLVIADDVVDANDGAAFAPPPNLVEEAKHLARRLNLRARTGRIATIDRIASEPHHKAFVGTQHDAIALDMESAVVARLCAGKNLPYLIVRGVTDPLDMHLPDLSDALDVEGNVEAMMLLIHLAQHSRDIGALPRLFYASSKAREAFSAFGESWVVNRTA